MTFEPEFIAAREASQVGQYIRNAASKSAAIEMLGHCALSWANPKILDKETAYSWLCYYSAVVREIWGE